MSNDPIMDLFDESSDEQRPTHAPVFTHQLDLEVFEKTRQIFVNGDIEENFGTWFTMVIRRLEGLSLDPITIWVNTPGGDVNSMFTFHDLVRASPCEVITIGIGQVCSAGVLMLACGNKRMVMPSCILMSHRGDEGISGKLEELKAQLNVSMWQEQHWASLMASYTDKDEKYWFQLGKKEAQWWLRGGQEIIDNGLVDCLYDYNKLP